MSVKWIFLKRFGRAVPIKVADGFTPAKEILKASAKTKDALKASIAAKTSLAEKRIGAVKSAREAFKKFYVKGLGIRLEGGMWHQGTAIGEKFVKTGKRQHSLREAKDLLKYDNNRHLADVLLSKKGVTPETFVVKTSKRKIFVQDKMSETMREAGPRLPDMKHLNVSQDIMKKSLKKGILPEDVASSNIGKFGKKWKIFDTGLFEHDKRLNKLKAKDIERLRKFTIKLPKKKIT